MDFPAFVDVLYCYTDLRFSPPVTLRDQKEVNP